MSAALVERVPSSTNKLSGLSSNKLSGKFGGVPSSTNKLSWLSTNKLSDKFEGRGVPNCPLYKFNIPSSTNKLSGLSTNKLSGKFSGRGPELPFI